MSHPAILNDDQKLKSSRLWRKIKAVAPVRFERYELADDEDDLQRVARFGWNIALCEAVTPTMNAAEISLRNGIHRSLIDATHYEEWLFQEDRFRASEQSLLDKAIKNIGERGADATCPNNLVAELPFRFWTGLLKAQYETFIWRRLSKFRGAKLPEIFPDGREKVYGTFNEARIIRNRASHHEPLFDHPGLAQSVAQTREAAAAISRIYTASVLTIDRFPAIWNNGNGIDRFRVIYFKEMGF